MKAERAPAALAELAARIAVKVELAVLEDSVAAGPAETAGQVVPPAEPACSTRESRLSQVSV